MFKRRFLAGSMVGAVITIGIVCALFFMLREKVRGCGRIGPFTYRFRVHDSAGDPVSGVELVVSDDRTGELWHRLGNWHGPGSLVTNAAGEVTLQLVQSHGIGGSSIHILGYTKEIRPWPRPNICLRYRGRTVASVPLGWGYSADIVLDDLPQPSQPQG